MRTPPFDREAARPNAIVQASPWLDCDAGLDHSQSNLDADADQRATSGQVVSVGHTTRSAAAAL